MATVRIQVRRGTSADWTSVNPVLAGGEMGVETNTRKMKIGDGTTAWNSLDYIASDSPAIGEIAQDAINDALVAGTGITKTYDDGANTITVEIDTTVIATQDYVDSAISNLSNTVDSGYIPMSDRGIAGGVASLGNDGLIPNSQYNTEYLSTVNYVDNKISVESSNIISTITDAAPTLLNTLNELSAAIGDDPNYAATITTELGTKLNKSGDSLTGFLFVNASPTQSGHVANKGYVDSEISSASQTINNSISTLESNTNNTISTLQNQVNSVSGNVDGIYTDVQALQTTVSGHTTDITTNSNNITTLQSDVLSLGTDITNAQNSAISSSESYTDSAITSEVSARNIAISGAVSTHNDETLNVHGILDTSALATKTYADSAASGAVSSHESDTTNIHGIADTSALATKTYADSAVSTHESDTTNIHGIADTSALATKTYADSAVSTHNSNTTTAHGATGEVVGTTNTQTLTNKTLTSPVINSPTGIVKADVGLENVDNTSDANKPVSTATQSALDLKANSANPTFTGTVVLPSTTSIGNVSATEIGYMDGVTSAIQTQLDSKAPKEDPVFTGTINAVNLTLSGNLDVEGTTTTINTSSLSVTDPLIYMGGGNAGNAVDLGIVSSFDDGTYQHSGLVRDASDSKWKLFKGVIDEPTTTINFTQGSLDSLAVGAFEASSITVGNVSNTEFGYLDGVTSSIQTQLDAKTTASKTETFTNKSISLTTNTVTGTKAEFNEAMTDADFATIAGTETLTNKTLTSPAMTSPTVSSGTLTVSSSGIVFTDGTQIKEGVPSRTPISSQAAAYTVVLTDRDSLVEVSNASAVQVTIPTNETTAFPVGTSIDILQTGAGQVSIVGAAGVTVNATPQGTANTAKLRAQWSSATLFKRSTDTWVVLGDLTA